MVCKTNPVNFGVKLILSGVQPVIVLAKKSMVGFATTLMAESIFIKAVHPIEFCMLNETDLYPVRLKKCLITLGAFV